MKKKIDILLIIPPQTATIRHSICQSYPGYAPVDTMALRTVKMLKDAGYNVKFLPLYNLFFRYSPKEHYLEVVSYLNMFEPKVVIFQTDYLISNRNTACINHAITLSETIKKSYPDNKIIFIGKHATIYPKEMIQTGFVDVAIKGECEEIIVDLVFSLLNNKNLNSFKGIVYKKSGEIIENPDYLYIENLNSLPVPDFIELAPFIKDIAKRNYIPNDNVPVTLRSSYGCPFNCIFCSGVPQWNQYRMRSAAKVEEDIDAAFTVFGERALINYLDDELFTYSKTHMKSIIDLFKKKNLRLGMVLTHTKFFDEEVAMLLSEVCNMVSFGAENSCLHVLDSLNKHQTFEDIRKAIDLARKYNMEVSLDWLIGLPNETVDDVIINLNNMFKLIIEDKVFNLKTYVLTPHPGTALEKHPEEFGVIIHHRDWEDYIEWGGYPAYSTKHLSSNQIYTYWLLAQMVVREAQLISKKLAHNNESIVIENPLEETFKRIFIKIKG